MSKRLWEKGEALDTLVHRFTVGNDPVIDSQLARYDCIGSAAHARMLAKIGVLTDAECRSLLGALKEIYDSCDKQPLLIPDELEDVHTTIESILTEKLGEVGKKIHAGRSRNDQIILDMRLYLRDHVVGLSEQLSAFAKAVLTKIGEAGDTPMPGYTHMQPAMPSSLKMWLQSWLESTLELLRDSAGVLRALDSNPLGAAAGFGSSIALDRKLTAELLDFSRVQRSVIDVQNSRGQRELKVARWCVDIAAMFEKMANDLILYSMREFGFFSLPNSLTTGSSIMPQKHNPDVLELVRARAGRVRASVDELGWITAKLPSNFHRDFQYTKEPTFKAVDDVSQVIAVMMRVVELATVNREVLEGAMYDDLYATYDAYRSVKEGKPFREAYRLTAERIAKGEITREALEKDFSVVTSTLDGDIKEAKDDLLALDTELKYWRERVRNVEKRIFNATN